MKTNILLLTIYGGCGVAAALAPNGLLDSRLAVMALCLLYTAHMFWRTRARKRRYAKDSNPKPKCLACRKELGLFHRLAHHRFCSEQHEHVYLAELEEIALARLQGARIAISLDARVEDALNRKDQANADNQQLAKLHAANVTV